MADIADAVPVDEATSDAELVRRAAAGDVPAFETLYRRHVGRTFALCLRMTAARESAEEFTQAAWVRAWMAIGTFREASAFSTWLHRITVNVVLHERRESARRQEKVVRAEDGRLPAAAASGTGAGDLRLDIERALADLPERARLMFVLHHVEGYRQQEIAEMTGTTLGTVKSQIFRARRLLRKALA